MASAGSIDLDLRINNRQFNKQVDGIQKQTTKAFSAMSVAVGNIVSGMIGKITSGIGNFVKDSIEAGSELSELQNVVDSVFTTMNEKVNSFAKGALDAYGLTEKQAKKMVGTFGAMSESFGYTEKQAYSMATALTGLTGDVASFYNLDIDEAYTKMKSVYTGETESLKELGVVMTQAALDQFALANGYGKTTAKMSEQEKVALRLAFVQDKLKVASGDFLKTQDSWANQARILEGQFESLKTAIGEGLINVLTPVIRVINTIMAKLVQLANAFKSFTAMITGNKNQSGAGAAMKDVSDAAGEAASSTEQVEDAANGAAKAAKAAQKSLMGFDEINKLSKTDSGSDSGGGDVSGALFDDIDFGSAVDEMENKANSAMDALLNRAKELMDLFKEGFKAGLGDDFEASLERTKEHIQNIGKSLQDIFTDPRVVESANKCFDKIAYALGQVAGSVVSIGQTIGENLFGGIDYYLDQNKDFIKDRLVGIFDATGEIAEIVGNFSQTIAEIFEVFRGDTAKQCTADFIGIFANAFLSIKQLALQVGRDVLYCITQPIIDNKDKIKQAIENTLKPLSTILSTFNTSVKATFEKVFQVYDERIRPAFEGIASGLSSLLSTILDTYNQYVAPVVDSLANTFSEVWASKIQPTIDKIIELIGKLATLVSTLFQNIVVPFINWLISTLGPVLMPLIKTIGQTVLKVIGSISTVLGGIIDILGGIIDFISGVFSGNWELCWNGIKSIFEGFCGTIEGLISGLINFITGIFSGLINILSGIVSLLWQIICGIFTTAINAITSIVSTGFNLIAGIITNINENIKFFIGTIWNMIKGILLTILDSIKTIFQTVWESIKLIITTIVNIIKTVITTVFNGIKSVIMSIFNAIKAYITTVWNEIKMVITTVINLIKLATSNGFGAMKTAISNVMSAIRSTIESTFNGIWNFMKGIINTILGGIQGLVNGVINGLNSMIRALNSVSFDTPDWVPGIGGKSFGFNIGELSTVSLPRLATGGYVRANQPQPVIVGDNKTQGEIISPENKMLEVMLEALNQFFKQLGDAGYSSRGDGEVGDIVIPIYLDGSLLDEVIVTAQQRRNLRSGGK